MKWLGQYIQDLPSRFRDDVYLEDLSTTTETNVLVVDSNGKVSKSTTLADDIIEAEIDTLPGLISFGAAGVTTNVLAGDLTMYNAVNDGNPTISLGSAATNRFEIKSTYNSGNQQLCDVDFTTYTASSTSNDGRYNFYVDEVLTSTINDNGIYAYNGGQIQAQADGATLSAYDTTTSSATEGGKLRLMNNDGAAMASGHRLGVIEFYGAEDASNTMSVGARIEALTAGGWGGSENKTNLLFYTTDGTTQSEVLKLDSDKLATFTGAVTMRTGVISAGNDGIVITDTSNSSATTGGSLKLIADDDEVLADNHRLGVIEFQSREVGSASIGYSATGNIQTGARIQAIADATWSTTENGASLEFYTTDGNASESVVLTLDSNKLATFTGAVTVTGALTGTLATASQTNITSVGTISAGTWQSETVIASAYLDADTAHLSASQTFTGTKTLNSFKGTGATTVTNILDEDAMGSDSATALATQQSIKAYVDDIATKSVLRSMSFYINDNPMVQNSLYFGHTLGNQDTNWNDPAAVGGAFSSTATFTIAEDDHNWGILLPFDISKIEIQCSVRPALGTGDDFSVVCYSGIRSDDSNTALTLTKIGIAQTTFVTQEYKTNDLTITTNLNKNTMIYVGVGSEDNTDAKSARGFMNVTVTER